MRQVADRAQRTAAHSNPTGAHHPRPSPVRRRGPLGQAGRRSASVPGKAPGHDLPGSRHQPEPAVHHSRATRRCRSLPTERGRHRARAVARLPAVGATAPPRRPRPRRRVDAARRYRGRRDAAAELPPPVLRRDAAAGADRHGAGRHAGFADRRRAHDRPRRHHPGPDPQTDHRPGEDAGPERAADHARPGRGRQDLREGRRDVRRARGRAGPGSRALSQPRTPLYGAG